MSMVRTITRSFAGGEIAPELYGRMDLDKYQTGLNTCRNMIALPYGPAMNRPGFAYVNQLKDSVRGARLIPFSFSADETMVLEFGQEYIRFHTNGGTLLEATVAIDSIAGNLVTTSTPHGYSIGDWVFIGGRFWIIDNVPITTTFTVDDLFGVVGNPLNTSTTAARVYEIASPYNDTDLFDLHYVQSNDVLTVTHPTYPVQELRRLGATNWTLTPVSFLPLLDPPENISVSVTTGSGTTLYRYLVTALSENGLEESVASQSALGTTRARATNFESFNQFSISAMTNASPGVFTTFLSHGLSVNNLVYVDAMDASGVPEFVEGWYLVNTVPTGTTFTLKTEDGVVLDTTTFSAYSSAQGEIQRAPQFTTAAAHGLTKDDPFYFFNGSANMAPIDESFLRVGYVVSSTIIALKDGDFNELPYADLPLVTSVAVTGNIALEGVKNNLTVSPNKNTVKWTAVAGAARYNVYKNENGVFGYIGQTSGISFVDTNILPDTERTPPELSQPFEAVGSYPSAVSYFDQRRAFAATDNLPQTLWMSRAGTESNFSSSSPLLDSDAIVFKIAAREQNRIRHLVPLSDLIMLTAGGEWRVFTGSGDPVTPSTVIARPQSYVGANNVQPVTTSLSAIYVSAQGSKFRELVYSADGIGSYRSEDLSVLIPHLTDNYLIEQLAFSRAPIPIMWAVRNDGALLGLTYLPEQRVRAWHRHDTTNGEFESVCSVAEGNEDATYVVVKRVIDGNTVRYIERMTTQQFDQPEDAFFVDSGLTYSGTATTTISGLWHLEGEEVAVLGDGAVFPRKTVTNGAIELEQPVEKAQIGLPIEADLVTLPLSFEGAPANGSGYVKNVTKAHLRVYRSSGIFVGPSFDKLVEYKQRTTEPYGSPPSLKTEEITVSPKTTWARDGVVCIRQSDPLPLTVQTLSLEVSIGG